MKTIEVDSLSKSYGRRVGVDALDLSVGDGALFGFLGPNGSGKSTTIRVLLGLLRPDRGQARVFGLDCWRQSACIKADVGYVPGDLRLYPWFTGRKALKLFGQIRGQSLDAHGSELAGEFRLDLDVPVRHMSRGMRQKLGLILAMAHRPRLLILDEPSTGLDPLIQDRLFARLRMAAEEGRTVFFSSHTLSEVELLCDHVAILKRGRVVACEALESLRSHAPREASIVWKEERNQALTSPPSCLRLRERSGRCWSGTLTGGSVDFIRWCAGQAIEDVSVGAPDLAGLFRHYYRETDGQA